MFISVDQRIEEDARRNAEPLERLLEGFPPMVQRQLRMPAIQSEAPLHKLLGQLKDFPWNCNPTPKRPSGSRWQ